VTGASGFIGRHLVEVLAGEGYQVRAASRQPVVFRHPRIEGVSLGDMSRSFSADYIVRGCDLVVHAAGMAHARADLPDALYTAINVDATRELARAARAARIKRFVLMSSVRAQIGPRHNGVITEATLPEPTDAYGRSKLAAEALLPGILDGSQSRFTVLRPVLVYGPGVKGNMASLIRIANLPVPLPFGALKSRRSLLSIGNLVSAVRHVLASAVTENGTYLVADEAPVTIAQIIKALRRGLGRSSFLVPIPQAALAAGLRLAKRQEFADRLVGELVVDASRLRATGWTAPEETLTALAASCKPA